MTAPDDPTPDDAAPPRRRTADDGRHAGEPRGAAAMPEGGARPATQGRHTVGPTDAQRARLTELIESAPLPVPHVLTRLRGYLPPVPPD